MPPSLCNALKILMWSHNAQYVSRQHQENEVNFGHLDGLCETLPSNHHATLQFIPNCSKAENILKQTIIQVLSAAQNAHVKLMTVSSPENFFSEQKQKSHLPVPFQSEVNRCNNSWKKRLQKDLVVIWIVRGNMKNTTHWERRLIQRRHCFFSSVWLSLRNQTHRSKAAYCPMSTFCKKE